ncbi:GNAT family N-acetyltransferase [Streptomyces sp. NPDC053493]|uniref:GNAT family N-acetyltransferase n=1 Tax=Streptomyces sp. NPDC053493 TaxID=3365705 RepID=UPI0037D2F4C8
MNDLNDLNDVSDVSDVKTIETDRLLLHPLTREEARRIVDAEPAPGDRWAEGYPGPGDARGAQNFLRGAAERGDPGDFRAYEIRLRDGGTAVGGIGFHGPPDEHGIATVGYGLVPAVRGRGYASEALRGLVDRARAAGAAGVRGDADLDNTASHRVMEAAGLLCDGEDERLRHYRLVF